MIDEIKAARDSNEYEQWMDDDLKRSKFFWTIGLGEKTTTTIKYPKQ